jgi:hypothetical protein
MGEKAEARQTILPYLPGSAEVGRHDVCPDQYHECSSPPPKAELAYCG